MKSKLQFQETRFEGGENDIDYNHHLEIQSSFLAAHYILIQNRSIPVKSKANKVILET